MRRILRYKLFSILHPCFISAMKKLHIFSFSKQPPFCCRPVQFAAVCTFSLFYFTPPFHCRPVQFAANPKVSAALAAAATMNTTAITGNDFQIWGNLQFIIIFCQLRPHKTDFRSRGRPGSPPGAPADLLWEHVHRHPPPRWVKHVHRHSSPRWVKKNRQGGQELGIWNFDCIVKTSAKD